MRLLTTCLSVFGLLIKEPLLWDEKSSSNFFRSWWGGREYRESYWIKTHPDPSISLCVLGYLGISLERSCNPGRQLTPPGIVTCADSCIRRVWNTTRRRLGLGPCRTVSYPSYNSRFFYIFGGQGNPPKTPPALGGAELIEGARYRANCLPGLREPFKRDTVYRAMGF